MDDKTPDPIEFAIEEPVRLDRPDRRTLLIAGLGVGFALAADPVLAQVITTSTEGLVAGEVQVPAAGADIPAYRAMPDGPGPYPTVLVVQEIFGVHEHIKDICRRLAHQGYYAIAPELFVRQGDATKADLKRILQDIVPKVPDAQVMADLDSTVEFARASGAADTRRLGIVGFCWGGRIVWIYAAHNPKLAAGVAFYGILGGKAAPTSPLKPVNPVDIGAEIKPPVLGLYAGQDDNIPQDLVTRMQDELKRGGGQSEIIVYPDVPHGFNADYRPSYRPEAAKDAWGKAMAWFKTHGVA